MSMTTMRGYMPKDDPMYPAQPKVISRFGFTQSSTDTAKSLDGATPVKLPSATGRQDGKVAPAEGTDIQINSRLGPQSTSGSDHHKAVAGPATAPEANYVSK